MSNKHIGLRVLFGRPNGEKTLGEIVKYNPSKAKVKILESRGQHSQVGAVWGVPYSLMRTETGLAVNQFGPVPATPNTAVVNSDLGEERAVHAIYSHAGHTPPVKAAFVPCVYDHVEYHIIEAICSVYYQLEPESLTCDGERPISQQRQIVAQCQRRLRGLFAALGHEIDESEAFDLVEKYRKANTPPEIPRH